MFMDRKTQYCQFFSILSIDSMQSQSKSQQVILWVLTTDSKVYMERQKTQSNQNNIEGKAQSQKTDATQLQDLL